jgi:hypothetical protein
MRLRYEWVLGLVILTMPLRAAEGPSLPERYAEIYLGINTAEQSERHGDYKGAVDGFKDCYVKLAEIRKSNPDWETALVLHRLADLKAKILELQPKADAAAPVAAAPAGGMTNAAPAAATNLPANLPPEVKAFQQALPHLQAETGRTPESPEAQGFFSSQEPMPQALHNNYPWKANITAEVFWIGQKGVKDSAWNAHWERDYGGTDAPDFRNGYAPGGHACGLSPFYVALPFDDLKHPELAQKWLPKGWARAPQNGNAVSVCKDRWVELKNSRGDDCFAQWEDAWPGGNAQPEYVFGDKLPQNPAEPAIDVSPAVAAYLGLADAGPKIVSWRFVDEANVRPGAWMKLDEQAVIYMAMKAAQK